MGRGLRSGVTGQGGTPRSAGGLGSLGGGQSLQGPRAIAGARELPARGAFSGCTHTPGPARSRARTRVTGSSPPWALAGRGRRRHFRCPRAAAARSSRAVTLCSAGRAGPASGGGSAPGARGEWVAGRGRGRSGVGPARGRAGRRRWGGRGAGAPGPGPRRAGRAEGALRGFGGPRPRRWDLRPDPTPSPAPLGPARWGGSDPGACPGRQRGGAGWGDTRPLGVVSAGPRGGGGGRS